MGDNEKTVYILGAGFSRAFSEMTGMEPKFPVMDDFMKLVENHNFWLHGFPNEEKDILIFWINEHYKSNFGINIEELMTIFELMKEGYIESLNANEIEGQRNLADKLIHSLKNYIRLRLALNLNESDFSKAEILIKWLINMRKNKKIISFNLDILIETAIGYAKDSKDLVQNTWNFLSKNVYTKDEMWSPFFDRSNYNDFNVIPLRFIKLHGSIDWLCCSNDKCFEHFRIYHDIYYYNNCIYGHGNFPTPAIYCPMCGSPMEFVILPPQMVKEIDRYPRLKVLWRLAAHSLKLCDRIVVIGYSFPLNDTRTTYLMMRSLEGRANVVNWTIVDIDPEKIQKRLIEILPKHENNILDAERCYSLMDYLEKHFS